MPAGAESNGDADRRAKGPGRGVDIPPNGARKARFAGKKASGEGLQTALVTV